MSRDTPPAGSDERTAPEPDGWALSRRALLGAAGGGLLAALATAPTTGQSGDGAWTVVALPDTQFYATSDRLATYAADQTEWIVDNLDAESIRFVAHEGDLVDNGSDGEQWRRIDPIISRLDGKVPYATPPGNHDWAVTSDKSSSTRKYRRYFGPSRYEDRSWYGGSGPDGLNSYQLFSAGGYDFLHLALEWEPSGSVDDGSTPLGWAQSVLDEYPDRPTILTTHSYLRDDGRRATESQDNGGIGNSGEVIWQELVKPNRQVFLVLNGHWWQSGGEYHQVSTNAGGLPVYEVVADYQNRTNGGNGWLRLVRFEPGQGEDAPDRIRFETYSPSLDKFETDNDSAFAFDLDFSERFDPDTGGDADGGEQQTFQQGRGGYNGTVDTNLREADPEQSFASAPTVTVDAREPQSSNNRTQALVRFDGIVGGGEMQIPTGATVRTATLSVETVDGGDGGAVNRMLTDWSADDTWASLGGGVDPDGEQAAATPEAETGPVSTGRTAIDVTASVRRWVDGDPNYGWVLRPLGDDGWDFETAEGDTPPALTVRYDPPRDGDADGDGDVDGDDVRTIQRYVANDDVDINREAADVDDDGDVDIGDAVIVDDLAAGGDGGGGGQ